MRNALRFVVVVCSATMLPFSLWGQVTATARLDSTTFLIGDRIVVHVGFHHPKGAVFRPLEGDTVGGFHLLSRGSFKQDGDTETSTDIILGKYSAGGAVIPPLQFPYLLPGEKDSHTVSTNALDILVNPVPVDTTQEIKDLKAPLSIPLSLADVALYAGILALIGLAGVAIWKLLKKRKLPEKGEPYVPPPRPAHVIALEELAILKEKKLWQQGLIKQYYSEATEILRRYIENRYQLMALEETTDEILAGLKAQNLPSAVPGVMERVLRRADLVKFAKHLPGVPEHEETLAVVYDVVDKTKLVAMTPVSQAEAKAGTRVGT